VKIPPIPKTVIRNIVGRMHVAASDQEVEKFFRSRLAKSCPEAHADRMAKFAVEAHHQNQRLCHDVVLGLHKRAAARKRKG
jgi:hypothetical protein